MGKMVAKEKKKKIKEKYVKPEDTHDYGSGVYLHKDTLQSWKDDGGMDNLQAGADPDNTKSSYLPGDNEDFGVAFSKARDSGNPFFWWRGKKYTTKQKGE